MVKHILVPTDGSPTAMLGVRYGVAVARHYGAVLHGLHVVDIKLLEGPFLRDISASLGTAPYINYQGNIAMLLEERGNMALEACAKVCVEQGVECETTLATGLVTRTIVERSELADLVVLGRGGEHSQWLDGLLGSTTQAVVRRAGRPVLVTGRDTPGQALFLTAYDGSANARRALQVAAQTTVEWGAPLHVLAVEEPARAEALCEEARTYLRALPAEATYVVRQGDPGEAISGYARECGADLLVMGAFGHTKVRELVVGSTTAYVLNKAPCPLLLTR